MQRMSGGRALLDFFLAVGFDSQSKGTQPVVDDRPRFRGRVVSLGAAWIGSIICGSKRPSIGNLPKRPRRHVEAKENVAPLTAHSMRLKQILLNLSNAFKFTKEGK